MPEGPTAPTVVFPGADPTNHEHVDAVGHPRVASCTGAKTAGSDDVGVLHGAILPSGR
jgi:hypothetical protein